MKNSKKIISSVSILMCIIVLFSSFSAYAVGADEKMERDIINRDTVYDENKFVSEMADKKDE